MVAVTGDSAAKLRDVLPACIRRVYVRSPAQRRLYFLNIAPTNGGHKFSIALRL